MLISHDQQKEKREESLVKWRSIVWISSRLVRAIVYIGNLQCSWKMVYRATRSFSEEEKNNALLIISYLITLFLSLKIHCHHPLSIFLKREKNTDQCPICYIAYCVCVNFFVFNKFNKFKKRKFVATRLNIRYYTLATLADWIFLVFYLILESTKMVSWT